MSVFKSIFGALVGAAAATGVYFVTKQVNGEAFAWLPIVTGILTGLVAGVFGGSCRSTSARFVCGACAALIAGVAMFGIDFLPTHGDEQTGEFGPLPSRSTERVDVVNKDTDAEDQTDEAADTESGADDSDDEVSDAATGEVSEDGSARNGNDRAAPRDRSDPGFTVPEGEPGAANRVVERIKKKRQWDTWMPFVFSGIGMLLAYQLARGFGSGPKENGGGG